MYNCPSAAGQVIEKIVGGRELRSGHGGERVAGIDESMLGFAELHLSISLSSWLSCRNAHDFEAC